MKSESCVWYVHGEEDIPYQKRVITAACIQCAMEHKIEGMFWEAEKGYGDYDLDCKLCKRHLHRRNSNYEQITPPV